MIQDRNSHLHAIASPKAFRQVHRSSLSQQRCGLIDLMARCLYCRIEGLIIRDGEPVLPPEVVVRTVKLGNSDAPHPVSAFTDYVLKKQVIHLLNVIEDLREGVIDSIVVVDGLPIQLAIRESGARAIAGVESKSGGAR